MNDVFEVVGEVSAIAAVAGLTVQAAKDRLGYTGLKVVAAVGVASLVSSVLWRLVELQGRPVTIADAGVIGIRAIMATLTAAGGHGMKKAVEAEAQP